MRILPIAAAMVAAALLTGCASPARVNEMVPQADLIGEAQSGHALHESLRLKGVNGGDTTNPMWTSEIGNPEFHAALRKSLDQAGLLATNISAANYTLEADLLTVDQPMFGMSFTVSMESRYLISSDTGQLVYNEVITSTGTATFSDAFLGVERLRIASERAAQNNIKALVQDLLAREQGGLALGQ